MQMQCNVLQVAKTPSHTSVRRWINQVGYYNLVKPKDKAIDWVYFIDNSIRIENRKVCLILGTRLSKLEQGKYLSYKDLEVVAIRLITRNNEVEAIIEDAIAKTGVPEQICSDEGSDIMPSIRKIVTKYPNIKHVPDIMHKTGNKLKKKLENDKRWKIFITHLNEAKRRLCQSSLSFICPPNLRGKSRFLNCQWASRTIIVLQEMDKADSNWVEMNEKLGWLVECKQDIALFTELFGIAGIAKEIVRTLHIEKDTWRAAEELLAEVAQSEEGKSFGKEVVDFLKEQCKKAERGLLLIGSSEIIESAFSKLKLLDRECGNSGFTSSVLGLAACFGPIDFVSISKAFEQSSYSDVVKWGEEYVGETIQKKRRRILKLNKSKYLGLNLTRFIEEKTIAA
jgi:hypothetical protein